jgi:hypothetical protein
MMRAIGYSKKVAISDSDFFSVAWRGICAFSAG